MPKTIEIDLRVSFEHLEMLCILCSCECEPSLLINYERPCNIPKQLDENLLMFIIYHGSLIGSAARNVSLLKNLDLQKPNFDL